MKMKRCHEKEVQHLVSAVFQKKAQTKKVSKRKTTSFVAVNHGKVVGYLLVQIHHDPILKEKTLYLDNFVVDPAVQNQGIGKSLLETVFSYAKEKEVDAIQLTSRKTRVAAHHLYQKMGFDMVETTVFRKEMN